MIQLILGVTDKYERQELKAGEDCELVVAKVKIQGSKGLIHRVILQAS